MRTYVRFAALGDSTTAGVGDPVPGGWRGWARLLADAMGQAHDVSFCNLAVSGATVSDVRHQQLRDAVAHRPDVASLIVGVNDTMRSTWDAGRIREELLTSAETLHRGGAMLLTVRFHDHGAVFGLPGVLRRPLHRRIEAVNAAYDEIHAAYGGLQIDLAGFEPVWCRAFWSVDRLHPSELGHRALARAFAEQLNEAGLGFPAPSAERDGRHEPSWRKDLAWMVTEGAPWVGRRARDLGPWAARLAWSEAAAAARRRASPQEGRYADAGGPGTSTSTANTLPDKPRSLAASP